MANPNEPGRSGWWKWYICGILFLATVLCYLDRQTMSLCAPLIKDDFEMDNEQWGQLLSAFRWTYAIMQIPAGYLADLFSIRIVYAAAVGIWSAAGAAAMFVAGPRALGWTRQLLGVGEAFNWPCALRVTANTLPPEDRGLANGFFTSGAALGSVIAPFIILPLANWFGWRWAFFVIGALGAVWIAVWWISTRDPDTLARSHQEEPVPSGGPSLRKQLALMVRHPGFWLLMVVFVSDAYVCLALLVVAAAGLGSVAANYLAALQDISFASVGLTAGILGAFGNLVGATVNPFIGRYVDATGHYHLVFVGLGVLPLMGLMAMLAFDAVVERRKAISGDPPASGEA